MAETQTDTQKGTMTLGDFMARAKPEVKPVDISKPVELVPKTGTMTYEEFMGRGVPKQQDTVKPFAEENKNSYLKNLGKMFFTGMERGASDFNQLIGLNAIPAFKTGVTDPVAGVVDKIEMDVRTDNKGAQFTYDLAKSFGALGVTLPLDIVAGNITKMALAGKILPKIEAIVSKIPDFALGMGWKGLIRGVEEPGNTLEKTAKGILGAGEQVAMGTLYGGIGSKLLTKAGLPKVGMELVRAHLASIGKMSAVGMAEVVYEAAKEGKPPSADALIEGGAMGMAYGTIFAVLPHLKDATKIGVEKIALGKYVDELNIHIENADMPATKATIEKLMADPEVNPKIKQALKLVLSEGGVEMPKGEGKWIWGAEPAAAIPGEPIAFYDVKNGDFNTAKAQIIYDEIDNEPAGYKIQLKNGDILPNPKSDKLGGSPYFETEKEAMDYAEKKLSLITGEKKKIPTMDVDAWRKDNQPELSKDEQGLVEEINKLTKKDLKVDPRNGRNKADDIEGLIEEGSSLQKIFQDKINKLEGKKISTPTQEPLFKNKAEAIKAGVKNPTPIIKDEQLVGWGKEEPPVKPPVTGTGKEGEPAPEGDPYKKNFEIKEEGKRKATPFRDAISRTMGRIKEEADKAFVPISTQLDKVATPLKHALRKFEFRTRMRTGEDLTRAKPLLDNYSKLNSRDASDLDLALKNRDVATTDALISKHGLQKEFKEVTDLLNDIHKRAQDVGLDIGYIENYFPRRVKDSEGFISYLRGTESWSAIDSEIKRYEKAQGYAMSSAEKADFINSFIRSSETARTGKPGNIKERQFDVITPEMNQFYKDSSQALVDYVDAMNMAIETRRFFGKEEATVNKSIGGYVQSLVESGMISEAQIPEVSRLISSRFNQKGTTGLWTTYKNLSYMATLNTPINAITQIGDLAFSLYQNGVINTGKAVFMREGISKEDIGIHNIAQEFTSDVNTSSKLVNKLFQTIGLEKLDRIGKEALINAGFDRMSLDAIKRGDGLLPELETIFGDEAPQVLADLKAKKLTENVKYLLFSEVSDFQPISLSEMPERYLTGGNSRILYMLKSYTLKAIDVYHNDVIREMKDDPVKGMQNFVKLSASLVAMGVTTDWIKNFILGKTEELSDYVINNIIKTVGLNRYAIASSRREGLVSSLIQSIMPPVPFVDEVWQDAFSDRDIQDWKTWSKLPYIGTFYYWWFGGGASSKPAASSDRGGFI